MSDTLESLVERVRGALADPSSAMPATPAEPRDAAEAGQASGEAADGLVRATVSADGHVRSLTVAPELLRRPLADVAAAITAALNAALAARGGGVDVTPLVDVLNRVREQARHELAIVSTGFQDVQAGVAAVRAAQAAQRAQGRLG